MRTAIVLAAVWSACLCAQTNTGTITGLITDGSGSALPEAVVTVRELSTNAAVKTVTNSVGNYTVPSLPPGAYELTVTARGFKRSTANNVEVRATQTTTQNLTSKSAM